MPKDAIAAGQVTIAYTDQAIFPSYLLLRNRSFDFSIDHSIQLPTFLLCRLITARYELLSFVLLQASFTHSPTVAVYIVLLPGSVALRALCHVPHALPTGSLVRLMLPGRLALVSVCAVCNSGVYFQYRILPWKILSSPV